MDNLIQVKSSDLSDFINFRFNSPNMVPPNMMPSFNLSYPFVPQQYQMSQSHQQQHNWRPILGENGQSAIMYPTASTSSTVVTDSRRIQAMESTILYLRELLSKEVVENAIEKSTMDELKKELEASIKTQRQCEEGLAEKQEELFKTKARLEATEMKLTDTKKKLKELKEIQRSSNVSSESKISELTKELEAQKIQTGTLPLIKNDNIQLEANAGETSTQSLENKDSSKHQLLDATAGVNNMLAKQFKELAKKHLFCIEYGGEVMYNEWMHKHQEFYKRLKSLSEDSLTNVAKCSAIQQTLDSIQDQMKLVSEFCKDFKITVELLMTKIDQGLILVSDLNISAPKPQLEIPIENFEPVLEVISRIGSDNVGE